MPNIDVAWPLQKALYGRLTGGTPLAADITGVFDHTPEKQPFPYVTIGAFTSVPQGAHDRFGARSTVTLHIWSTYHGRAEVSGITDHLMRLLDHQPLDIDGHDTVVVRHEQTVDVPDPDPDITHRAVRFSVDTEHQPSRFAATFEEQF